MAVGLQLLSLVQICLYAAVTGISTQGIRVQKAAASTVGTVTESSLYLHSQPRLHLPTQLSSLDTLISSRDSATQAVESPFTVDHATVHGPVSRKLQATLEAMESAQQEESTDATIAARSGRGLLHGGHMPKKYPKCGRCRMVRCSGSYCSGHCRRNKKFFFCDSNNVISPAPCVPNEENLRAVSIDDRLPDSIADYDTVVVRAEAPYIGCANIANRPTGCPAAGTRARLAGRRLGVVVRSQCNEERYPVDCSDFFLPFGVCECWYMNPKQTRPRQGTRPVEPQLIRLACQTGQLSTGSGVGGADGSPSEEGLVVQESGASTLTWFSNFTQPGQQPEFVYSVTANVLSTAVDVSLSIFRDPTSVLFSDFLQEGVAFPEGYELETDYDPVPDGEVFDYYKDRIDRGYDNTVDGNDGAPGTGL